MSSASRPFGCCPLCGRTVFSEPLCRRPHTVNGLVVHQRCYRLLTDPDPRRAPTTPVVDAPVFALSAHAA